jgi:flagellar motor switch/type III secretory pathway protein FliN
MSARVYKLINRSEREALLAPLRGILGRWMEHYAAGDPTTCCTLLLADEAALDRTVARQWIQGTRLPGSEPALAMGLEEGWEQDLASVVLGERQAAALDPAGHKLIHELSAGLFAELGQRVLEALLPKQPAAGAVSWVSLGSTSLGWTSVADEPAAGVPALQSRSGDPTMLCECRLGERLTVLLALPPATVFECLASTPASSAGSLQLEPRSRALQSETVVLEAIVGEAEIAVEELGTLSVGDVLKLNRKIHQPVQLCVRGGGPVCVARLGALRGRTALQLT